MYIRLVSMQYFSKENEPFWKRNSKIITVTVITLVIIASSGTALYFKIFENKKDQSYTGVFESTRTSLPFTLNSNTTVTNRLGLKANSSTSSEKDNNIQALAAMRFSEISGTNFDDFAKLKGISVKPIINYTSSQAKTSSELNSQSGAEVSNPTNTSNSATNSPILDSTGISSTSSSAVSSKAPAAGSLVVYNENIISNFKPTKNSYLTGLDNIDYSKPITTKSWYSTNYRKFIAEQNGKIISYTLQTPNSYLEYLGGSYAITQQLDKNQSFSGLVSDNNQATTNWELEFIKSILSNNQIKIVGTDQIDGKTVNVYQENIDEISLDSDSNTSSNNSATNSNASNSKSTGSTGNYIKYYIDPNDIILYKTDIYNNNELTNSSATVKSLEYKGEQEDKFFTTSEIKDVDIKEAKDVSAPIPTTYLKIFSPKITPAAEVTISENQRNALADLRINKVYNPSLSDQEVEKYLQTPIVTITQTNPTQNLTTKIFDRDIDLEHYKNQNQQLNDKTNRELNLGGDTTWPKNCEFSVVRENDKIISKQCYFKYGNLNYLVSESSATSNFVVFENNNSKVDFSVLNPNNSSSTTSNSSSSNISSSSQK